MLKQSNCQKFLFRMVPKLNFVFSFGYMVLNKFRRIPSSRQEIHTVQIYP
jgi:hypothetical protein